jgi:Glycine zipper
MQRSVAVAVVILFLTGCATQGDQARTEGTLVGAGLGAAVGAGVGYLIGGSGTAAGIGAAIGAITGGAGGYVYADRVARRHDELAGKENDLDARIAFARGVNEDTVEYNGRLKKEVNDLEPKIADLAAKKEKQEITQRELEKQKQALATRVADANKQLAVGQEELQGLKKFRAEQKKASTELDQEIKTLEQNLAQMKSNTSALASLNQRI